MKTILITGSTDGIGKLVAHQLAKENHQLLLHGRNDHKLEQTITEIKVSSNNANIQGYVADLSETESILGAIRKLTSEHSKIDVFINNAGVFKSPTSNASEGFDIRFMVNYFAPYILTNGLVKLLENSDEPRLINLSSAAQSTVSSAALSGKQSLSTQEAYAQSKLALTMWSFWMARRYPQFNVIAVNPGSLLNTKMAQEAYGQYWSSADKGASILYDLAVSMEYKDQSGKYFDNDKGTFDRAHSDAYDENKIAELITNTNELLGL
ncbi:MAG: SDR family NAD(P)-dependent oxidoreductase [Bacteroidota bacterium]